LGGTYDTVVFWDFDKAGSHTSVISDDAAVAVAPKNAAQLDAYFREEVYATLRSNLDR
jgi:hypothetical protein